jgi:hypothetical protein
VKGYLSLNEAASDAAGLSLPAGYRGGVDVAMISGHGAKEPAMNHRAILTAATCVALIAQAAPGLADAIDGDWCRADGKRMTIRGPAIVTPGGKETRGDYTRHYFSYVIPAGEAGAGNKVSITLLSEYLAHAREGDSAPVQEWRRCQPGVS